MSETVGSNAAAVQFENVSPILWVRSLEASLDHYVNVLGFKVDWQNPGVIASVSRGRCGIMLCEGDQGHPGAWVWVGVGDIQPLFEDWRKKGAKIRNPPTNYSWAYEMQIEDPDGNVIRFGSEPKEDQPFGNWLDMNGDVWTRESGGGWTKAARD